MEAKATKTEWERGKDALEVVLQYVDVSKVEKLAQKLKDPTFRQSMAFKMFIQSL